MNKKLFLLLIPVFIVLTIFVVLPTLAPQKLIVAVGTETPPFEFYKGEQLVGIDIEFLDAIFSKLGFEYEVLIVDWDEALTLMEDGKADMLLEAGYSKERESFISYREEHRNDHEKLPEDILWISAVTFFYKKADSDRFSNITHNSLKKNNNRIGIVNRYDYYDELWEHKLNFYSYKSVEELIKGLIKGEIELAVIDKFEGVSLMHEKGYDINSFGVSKSFDVAGNYLLFSKKYDDPKYSKIKDDFYRELIRLKNEEQLHEKLYEKYVGENFSKTYEGVI